MRTRVLSRNVRLGQQSDVSKTIENINKENLMLETPGKSRSLLCFCSDKRSEQTKSEELLI